MTSNRPALIPALLGLCLAIPGGAQEVFTRSDIRASIQRIERHGDEFKSEFKKALERATLSAQEKRVRETAEDLEDEVDNLKQNYENKRYKEARENLDIAMLMAASIDRFMLRNYFGPEARSAWDNLRTDLNVIAMGFNAPPLPAHSMTWRNVPASGSADRTDRARMSDRANSRVEREVRHELLMLPYYGVFDHLYFRTGGDTVTLYGQVTRPTLKSGAERVVKEVEGVDKVVNEIEVLPVSPQDDRIRIATYRAIYGHAPLDRYGLQAVPPIHIVVKNGNVALEGIVANQSDKTMAVMQARSVPGVFSVTDHLRVE